jgi:hypothetical protein
MRAYFQQAIANRRKAPRDDLLTVLVQAEEERLFLALHAPRQLAGRAKLWRCNAHSRLRREPFNFLLLRAAELGPYALQRAAVLDEPIMVFGVIARS